MIIGRVTGEIYSTINHPFYDRRKILVVEKTTPDGSATGDYIIAIDVVDAGVGQQVLVIDEGNSARQLVGDPMGPVRSVVVGIIDEISQRG